MDESGQDLLTQLKSGAITYSQYEQAIGARQQALNNRPKRLRIDENVSLDQADKEARDRKKTHPTTGQTWEIPDRWSSTGTKPPKPGE